MRTINWDESEFHIGLITTENCVVKDIVNRYEKRARMGKETLIAFCVSVFCAGVEYQQHIITTELKGVSPSKVIGNCFINAMNEAFIKADIVAFADDLRLLQEIGKESFNGGIHYAIDCLHDALNDINDVSTTIL